MSSEGPAGAGVVDVGVDGSQASKDALRRAFAGMLVGSVSQHSVHHARCPVVVVHDARHELSRIDA
ncbi:MAG TPA: universal stress protein [Actinomycetes bacterium]|jgi:hypothetical protein|nr:universal stress protein [Actinomycetes bacterium]